MNKFEIQDKQYAFPYHYLPEIKNDTVVKKKQLSWGVEYMSYIKFVSDKIIENGHKNVLDVGCGDGRLCNIIHQLDSDISIRGIDLSQSAIAWARLLNPEIRFDVINILDVKEQYEAIACVEVIEHIPDEQVSSFFNGLSNALQNDGIIYLTVPSDNIPVKKKHYRHYNFNLLERQIKDAKCGLKIIKEEYIVPNVTSMYRFIMRLSSNKYWDLPFLDRVLWRMLWRNGLLASSKTGSHVYAELKHK